MADTTELCSRQACRKESRNEKICVHSQTGRYYCESCAHQINFLNNESYLVLIPRLLIRTFYGKQPCEQQLPPLT
jgi:hypothetical protein